MKIYFAGSIRGGRDDKEFYLKLISYLQKYGEVLTEHIGDKKLTELGEDNLEDRLIRKRDMDWIREADVIVADVSNPSLGVGYEIRDAENLGKGVLCLYRLQEGKRLSAMINGSNKSTVRNYVTLDDAFKHIDEFFTAQKSF
jgi:nucleoside 2-deoxyribosyltransferase